MVTGVLGVILGSAVNANGRTGGYTVPSPSAQSAVIRRAIKHKPNIPADTISAIECHGTGTALGDPIEIAGLSDALATPHSDRQQIAISSIKSNMGHLESAAGIAGLGQGPAAIWPCSAGSQLECGPMKIRN